MAAAGLGFSSSLPLSLEASARRTAIVAALVRGHWPWVARHTSCLTVVDHGDRCGSDRAGVGSHARPLPVLRGQIRALTVDADLQRR
jgi:hypothetical protein